MISNELRFNGPIPAHLKTSKQDDIIAEQGALAMFERMMSEYSDEAERLERQIEDYVSDLRVGISTDPFAVANLEVSRARYTAATRSLAWAMDAVSKQRERMGLNTHPIIAAAKEVK